MRDSNKLMVIMTMTNMEYIWTNGVIGMTISDNTIELIVIINNDDNDC